jgi:large subunit ribosomal protein L7/L12
MPTNLSQRDILEAISTMTSLELSELLRAIADRQALISGPALAYAVSPAGFTTEAFAAPGQDYFDVVMTDAGAKKIQVIKEVGDLTQLGLRDAKRIVDGACRGAPRMVLEKVSEQEARRARGRLESAGATVELR